MCNLFGKSVSITRVIMHIFKIDFFFYTVARKKFKMIPNDVSSVFSCYENNRFSKHAL